MNEKTVEENAKEIMELNTLVQYLQLKCPKCGRYWGCVPDPETGRIEKHKLICRECAVEIQLNNQN